MQKQLTKYEKKRLEIEHLLSITPKTLPKSVDKFIDFVCLKGNHHILYDRKSSYAFCSCCGKEINKIHKLHLLAKHGHDGKCPVCRVRATFRSIGRHRKKEISNLFQFTIIQKTSEGIVLRRFEVLRSLFWNANNKIKKEWKYNELQRIYNDGVKPRRIINIFDYYRRQWYWKDSKKSSYSFSCYNCMGYYKKIPTFEYRSRLEWILKGTAWQYAKPEQSLEYYAGWIKPCELLEKLGFNRLSDEIIHFNYWGVSYKANSLTKFMRLPKQLVTLARKNNYGQYELNVLQKLHRQGNKNITHTLVEFTGRHKDNVFNCCNLSPLLTSEKICDWFEKSNTNSIAQIHEYRDYLRFCQELGYDLSDHNIVFPQDLEKAHNREMGRITIKRDEKSNNAVVKRYKLDHKKYYFETNTFLIDAPKNIAEIHAEGSALHHCVGTYAKRVADGSTTILFIRKVTCPEIPFVTLELRKNKIIQTRAKNNSVPPQEVIAFITLWQNTKLNRCVSNQLPLDVLLPAI